MRRYFLACVTLALAVSVLGQTSSSSAPKPSSPANKETKPLCTVSGRVVTSADGSPLRSSRVALTLVHSERVEHIYAVLSDNDGRFLIKDVPAGQYTFFAFHAGYVQQHYKSQGDDEGAILTLAPGQKVDDTLFRLTRAAAITGRVMNEDEEPLVGVGVFALQKPSEDELEEDLTNARKRVLAPAGESQTDDRGLYRIFGLKPGDYYIRASDKADPPNGGIFDPSFFLQLELGSEYAPAYFPGVAQVGQAEVISVKPGEEAQANVTLRHVKTADVAGRVVGSMGPAKRAAVSLAMIGDDDFQPDYQCATDDTGAFNLKGIPPGSYMLSVYQRTEHNGISAATARQKIEVNGENIESLTITTAVGATIQGRVRSSGSDAPSLDELHLSLVPTDESDSMSTYAKSNKDGTFEIKSLPEGTYGLHLWGLEPGWYLKSAQFGGEEVLEKGLQLETGAAGGRLEMVVSSASAQLEGSVLEDDQPLAGATVRVVPDPETAYNKIRRSSTRTDQTGHYSFPSLAPGSYQVIARSPTLAESGHLMSEAQNLTLSEHDRKALDLKIVKPGAE